MPEDYLYIFIILDIDITPYMFYQQETVAFA